MNNSAASEPCQPEGADSFMPGQMTLPLGEVLEQAALFELPVVSPSQRHRRWVDENLADDERWLRRQHAADLEAFREVASARRQDALRLRS